MKAVLTNMCMLEDAAGRVLVQHRLPKSGNPWAGLTFPGGHAPTCFAPNMEKYLEVFTNPNTLQTYGEANCWDEVIKQKANLKVVNCCGE